MAEHCALDFRHKKTRLFIYIPCALIIYELYVITSFFPFYSVIILQKKEGATPRSAAPTFHNKKTKERYMAQVIFIIAPCSVEHHIKIVS